MSQSPARPSYFAQCCAEPYRIFFPLGTFVGISGVSLWPLFFSGMHHSFYPGVMHARLMIEGFMGAFIIGFLGTAAPRLTDTATLSRRELWTLLALYVAVVAAHIAERPMMGDVLFLVLLAVLAGMMSWRFARSTSKPPPGFVLVGMGSLSAFAGTLLGMIGTVKVWPELVIGGANLLHVGWVLLHILGLGGFLLPRMLGLPPPPETNWNRRASLAVATGAVITGTLVIEPFVVQPVALAAVRVVAAIVWLSANLPLHRVRVPNVTLTLALRAALLLLVAGLAFPLCWSMYRAAGLHVIFLGGFSLMAFAVGTRVVLGHGGFSHLFPARLPFLLATAFLVLSATGLRVAGEFVPLKRTNLLTGASHAWMLGAVLWAVFIVPKLRAVDPEP